MMISIDSKSTIRLQLISTFSTLMIIYILFGPLAHEEADLINEVIFIIFQPVLAVMMSVLTIAICLLIGLPIRLMNKLNTWWVEKPIIQISLMAVGSLLLFLSLKFNFAQMAIVDMQDQHLLNQRINYYLAFSGWFITAFSILHFSPGKKTSGKTSHRHHDKGILANGTFTQ